MFLDPVSRLYFEQWLAQRAGQFPAELYRHRHWGEDGIDALQDCLLKICEGRAKFNSVVDVEKWLWRCVHNGVIARWRRRLAEALGERDPKAPDSAAGSEDLMWLQRIVCACYRALNDYRKGLLQRYYLAGLSVEEIAVEMQLTKEAVKAVLYQARRQLRECLERNGVSYGDLVNVILYLAVFDCENYPPPEDKP